MIEIQKIILSCKNHLNEKNYFSFDLFDALTSNLIHKLTFNSQFLKRVAIQVNAKSPIDLHWLGMKKMQHTKTISDSLWFNCLILEHGLSSKEEIKELWDLLLKKRATEKYVWGLNFPYSTRFIDADANMPNLYNTCTAGLAISYYCETFDSDKDILEKIYSDLCSTFNYVSEDSKGFFIYYPGQKHPTYNVNALALYLFSRINKVTGKVVVPLDRMNEMTELLMSEQLDDGSWYYSRSENGKWVDGFHTGFILESLIYTYNTSIHSDTLKKVIEKGIKYYLENMFTDEGLPKYFDYSSKYPIESQNCAQAIQTLEGISNFEGYDCDFLLDKLVKGVIKNLYSRKGFFFYKVERYYTFKFSYLRWATAPMLVALSYYYNYKKRK